MFMSSLIIYLTSVYISLRMTSILYDTNRINDDLANEYITVGLIPILNTSFIIVKVAKHISKINFKNW